jgi:hypothetical protein
METRWPGINEPFPAPQPGTPVIIHYAARKAAEAAVENDTRGFVLVSAERRRWWGPANVAVLLADGRAVTVPHGNLVLDRTAGFDPDLCAWLQRGSRQTPRGPIPPLRFRIRPERQFSGNKPLTSPKENPKTVGFSLPLFPNLPATS